MVRAEGLVKVFRDGGKAVRAVDGVGFEAIPGEALGILGVNGAGKTTLLRLLSTMLQPTEGHAEVNGFDVVREPQSVRASVGFLSASTAVFGRLTAREMIELFARLNGLQGRGLRARVDETVDRFGIGPFADQLCDRLSTGQKQRVSIARTIVHDPPVLLFDEPTSGLDVLASQGLLEYVEQACRAGKTVLYSTHAMHEAQRLCARAIVIHGGRLVAAGETGELVRSAGAPDLERAFLHWIGRREPQTIL
ncbi:MAG: ATP-binding cassette domain-containing protein [Fimbriimonadales bacterium]|nr:ATP-binding cassette domain-containing protein [Fimbriimonadales bacterium]